MNYVLTCHCKAVTIHVTLSEGLETARRCDCSYCSRRGAIAVSAALDGLEIVTGNDMLSLYQWGTKTAKHYFCNNRGIYTHHQRRSDPNQFGINVACLEGVDPKDLGDVRWVDGINHPCDRKQKKAL
ncbi:GFA family protein [Cognatishimia sp. WU-CL00825]|uniref:GFA family protein n=1 Tax=Cognatishimia sp. WU-CL00825 TaxID=3127658 RepID=UPI003106AC8E